MARPERTAALERWLPKSPGVAPAPMKRCKFCDFCKKHPSLILLVTHPLLKMKQKENFLAKAKDPDSQGLSQTD
jgi:hypothetical protein